MNWKNEKNKRLVQALLALETPSEARRFLRDLMTKNEILEFANRFRAAQMLADKISYLKIEKETGLSSTTVARVSKWLNKGEGGYKNILSKLHHSNSIQSRRGRQPPP